MGLLHHKSAVNLRVGSVAPTPPKPRREEKILESWTKGYPKVSVLCAVYNHEEYLARCLDGILCQRTQFPFEVLIRDDASSDRSKEIILDYRRRYPRIIKVVLKETNSYNSERAREDLASRASAPYIAICDGDDYWFDRDKLGVMVAALQLNPEASMAHHKVLETSGGRITGLSGNRRSAWRSLSPGELLRGEKWVLPVSIVYRNYSLPRHFAATKFVNYDRYLLSCLGKFGGSIFLDRFSAAYQVAGKSMWSGLPQSQRKIEAINSYRWIAAHYEQAGEIDVAEAWRSKIELGT
jgi:glycosyltransferase involved in cell wall biosynthesis